MVARGRENLIFNDARVWRGTNPSIVLEFLDFRAWPASRPTQILERRLRPLCLERPKAKEDWPKHRCAPGITRVAPAAECAPPRTRHRPQARGAGNSHFSSENFVGDLRANGCSQRASNPVDGEYDSNPFFHNCSPRSNGMTAEQFRYASTTNRANRSAIAASSLAGRADFQDRTKLTQAAMELQLRSKARGTARKRGRPRTARRAAHHGSNLAIPAPLQAHSTSSQARHEHHFQLGAGASTVEKKTSEPGGNFGFDPLLMKVTNFHAKVRDLVETREFKTFQRTLRTGHQIFKRRLGAAHEWPPMSDSHVLTDG